MMSSRSDVKAMEYAADMLTYNSRKPTNAEAPTKAERGKSGRTGAQTVSATTGPILRERREAMGVTLAEAEVATRIRQKYLAALESDEWDLLPGEVVGRGFLRNYSTYLGIEPTEMIERRRAIADESLAAVLADTSAGSPLPPERAVDYRPKDVALHEETAELETPRRINLLPFVAVLGIAALAGLIWWAVTQFSDEIGDSITAAQTQIALWQQPAATPAVAMREESAALPENLVAPPVTAADTTPVTANVEATPLVADSAPAASVPAEVAAPTPVVEPTPPPEAQPEAPAVSLAALLPTPTPQPAEVAPPAEAVQPATVITAANLRQSPSTEAPIVGAATEGETLAIVGRTADGAWFQLESGAWIFAQLVNNPPADLPVIEAPPVATTP
jgi:cytoskeleton protein RodZ